MGVRRLDVGLADRPRPAVGAHRLPPLRRRAPALLRRPHGRGVPRPHGLAAAAHHGRRPASATGVVEHAPSGRRSWSAPLGRTPARPRRRPDRGRRRRCSTCCPPPARRCGWTASCTCSATTPPAERVVPRCGRCSAPGPRHRRGCPRVLPGGGRPGRHGQRRARGRGRRRARGLPRLVPARDAARGHLGRQPVRARRLVEDDGGPAAVAPAVVRPAGARPCAAPRGRGATHEVAAAPGARRRSVGAAALGRAERGRPAGHRPAAHAAARAAARRARAGAGRPLPAQRAATSSAGTGTTSCCCPAAGCRWCWATSPGTG